MRTGALTHRPEYGAMDCDVAANRFAFECIFNGLLADIPTAVMALLTVILAIATWRATDTIAKQRADALLPLLHWQEPHGAVAVDYDQMLARFRVQLVLWNVGPGAARIRKRVATSGSIKWAFLHFDEPSIVPSDEQLIVVVYLDLPVTFEKDSFNLVQAELPWDLQLCVQFEDVVERTNYTTRPRVRFVPLKGLPPRDTKIQIHIPGEPEPPTPGDASAIPGTAVPVAEFDPDSRSPSERRVSRDREHC